MLRRPGGTRVCLVAVISLNDLFRDGRLLNTNLDRSKLFGVLSMGAVNASAKTVPEHWDVYGIASDLESTAVYPLYIMLSARGLSFTGILGSPQPHESCAQNSYGTMHTVLSLWNHEQGR